MNKLLLALLMSCGISVAEQIVFTEVMYNPPAGKPEYVEIQNLTSNRLDMAQWRMKDAVDYTFPAFAGNAAHFLNEYERIVVSSADPAATRAAYPAIPPFVRVFGPWSATTQLDNSGDHIILEDATGARLCELSYGDSGKWPVAGDGTGHSIIVINPNRKIDDWRNWKLSPRNGGSPGNPEITVAEEVASGSSELTVVDYVTPVNYTSAWRYWRDPADPDGGNPEGTWKSTTFNDAAWASGNGFLGHEPSGGPLQTAIQTSFATGYVSSTLTYYFRTTFNWTGPTTGTAFVIDQYVDDGVIYWLNGQEIKGPNLGRVRMNAGTATHGTIASALPGAGDAIDERDAVTGSVDGQLVSGTNYLCAEVHQGSTSSSDIYFGARLKIGTPPPAGVVINEVRPAAAAGGGFVEFYNPTGAGIDLNGYYVTDTAANLTKYQITSSLVVPSLGLATIGYFESNLGIANPATIILTRPDGTTKQTGVSLSNPPVDGRSIGRKPTGGSQFYYFASPTPGAINAGVLAGNVALKLSEAHFGATGVDWVEFGNPTGTVFSGAGYFVASKKDFSDKVAIPASIGANGFASVTVNFATDGSGDVQLYFIDAANNVVDSVELERRAGLDSVQRFPLTSKEWYNGAASTQDAANSPALHDEIVINEIMFATPSGHDQGQFIELYNKSAGPVVLTGWRLVDGMDYDFPNGTTLAAGAYLVVAKDPGYITANYGAVGNLLGPASGSLRKSGELIRLEDERRNLADSVDYRVGGQWPSETGGEGSSLELLHPSMDNSQPSSWLGSNESNKATFSSYTYSGLYRELRGIPSGITTDSRELLMNLVSDGHVVLRNISFAAMTAPGTNLLPNGTATSHTGSGANGFHCTGTHCLSDTLADGFHLISVGSGDTKANKAEVDIPSLTANTNYTLSFEARWVSGMPLMVAQTWDRSFGKVFRFSVPNNLGTPGSVNSRVIAAPAPTADSLTHFPVVPTSAQAVTVTAKVTSAAPLTSVNLFERTDLLAGGGTFNSVPMNDSGTGVDAVSGDGIWSASVAAKGDGTITQFYVRATSNNGQFNDLPRNALGVAAVNGSVLQVPARPAMWIVDNSPPATAPGILTERYILAQFDRASLDTATGYSASRDFNFPRMSNFGFNSTMIYNETDYFYNCEMRKGGSPWTRDGGNGMSRIRYKPPGDNQWRNRSKSGIDNDAGGNNRFHNRVVRYMLHTIGYQIPDSEFCQRIVNADGAGLGDDQEQTDDDFFDRAYADNNQGQLFEIDDAWFMYDSNNMDDRLSADQVTGRWMLGDWANASITAPSEESPIYFHSNWPLRFPEARYDYAPLAQFIKTVYNNNVNINAQAQATQDAWREQVERQIDVDRVAAYAAARGYIGDWDNFTLNRGKNGYFFRRPTDGKFEFHHWDSDLGFSVGENVIGGVGGTGFTNLSGAPYFRRSFHYYLTRLQSNINGGSSRMATFLAAMNYQSTNADGLAPFKTAVYDYTGFFAARDARITTEINSFGGTNTTRAASISTFSSQTVTTALFTLNGEAPAGVWSVDVLNHPEGVFAWVPTTANAGLWTITNIALASGANNLTIRFLAKDGTVMSTLPFSVTLNGNGPPIARLTMDPSSGNLARNEFVNFSGATSTDPEGGALTFTWSVNPSVGAVLTPTGNTATARFTVPGSYTVTMSVLDAASNLRSASRTLTVYDTIDFAPFSPGLSLPAGYTAQNVEYRDSYSPNSWYSLEDNTGRILIQITDEIAKPLTAPSATFPLITRDLPDAANFILQTEVTPQSREFGNWQSGLWIEVVESGVAVRYTFSLDGGTNVSIRRAADPSNFTQISTAAHAGTGATLRIRRNGTSLIFERRGADGLWGLVFTQSIPSGSIANTGGIFAATSVATSALTAFDYILLSDPTNATDVLSSLRITEIMYNPAPTGGEYIEFRNVGAQPINLNGVYFDIGSPIATLGAPDTAYTFGNEILNPGAYIVITENIAAFQALYGNSIRLGAAWTSGSLNNGGERITLRDSFGNTIQNIHDFDYDDIAPWPLTPDGTGPSLEVINVQGNYSLGTNWRASGEPAGSPGRTGVGPDSDGDGIPDSIEALFGTNPNDFSSRPAAVPTRAVNGDVTITWPSVNGVDYRIEKSDDLITWVTLATINGTGSYIDTTAPAETKRFYRVAGVLP